MLGFYKRTALALLIILLLSSFIAFECFYQSKHQTPLLPAEQSDIPWRAVISSDQDDGGRSTYSVKESSYNIDYDFWLHDGLQYPYVSFATRFTQPGVDAASPVDHHVDLSSYTEVKFKIKCNPANIMMFTAFSFDEKVSTFDNLLTYRIPSVYFACDRNWTEIEIDLNKLETPEWWLRKHANLASRDYSLKQTASFTFGNSIQSPLLTKSNVAIDDLVLESQSWAKITLGTFLLFIIWGSFVFWVFKHYAQALTADVKARLQKDIPLIAYQQLSIESHKDKERSALLKYMVTEYQNPHLDLETVSQQVGINKTKVNDILKEEIGLTFNAYLNKLRLTEAARLLSENNDMNVAEVAFSVGYNNASYFNRLFKIEYGCAPKAFKSLKLNQESEAK
ncbi:helix-turn-helix domain-containing protein [Cellvibrio mixtus]|uniref:helix-turn-helix domain-containing protein n=1 Tax=Cellvibrio mixtus TaxID=39650 RepID=UPI00058693F6|nr:AraC family transcriptional regulator [Cellvibrio mixtus]